MLIVYVPKRRESSTRSLGAGGGGREHSREIEGKITHQGQALYRASSSFPYTSLYAENIGTSIKMQAKNSNNQFQVCGLLS